MDRLSVGNVRLARIHEMVDTSFTPTAFFPDYDAATFESHLDWLAPLHYDVRGGRLILSVHSWLVRTARHTVLIDACVGNDKDRLPRAHWHRLDTPFLGRLREAGAEPEDIDYVMCTHMHADHVGWNTMLSDGRWVPTFPNARYLFGRIEYEHWLNHPTFSPLRRNAFEDSVLPIVAAHQAEMIEDGHQLDDDFTVQLAPGHTPGNLGIFLTSAGAEAVFVGDTIHHPVQIYEPAWSTFACTAPNAAVASRRRVLEHCSERSSLMLPAHFRPPHAGHVRPKGDGFTFEWLSS